MKQFFKRNKFLIVVIDFILWIFFSIPLALRKFFHSEQNMPIKKILILELWGIGDVVMSSSILGPLRARFPKAKICLLSKPHGKVLLGHNNIIDAFYTFDFPWTAFSRKYCFWAWDWKGLFQIIKKMRAEQFDCVLDARGDIRNNLLSFFISSGKRVGFGWTGGGLLLTDDVLSVPSRMHRVDAWGLLLRRIGIFYDTIHPLINITEEESWQARKFLRDWGVSENKIVLGVHPGAAQAIRRWSLARFEEVIKHAERDRRVAALVFLDADNYGMHLVQKKRIAFKGALRDLIAMVKEVDLLICNDTGVMHIATAVGTPVVAIFGPGDPSLIGPYSEKSKVVIKNDIDCRPCFDRCVNHSSICLEEINADEVKEEIQRIFDTIIVDLESHKL